MPREHFLCSATATDNVGLERKFEVYKLRGETFKIYNDRGHSHISHGSRKVNEEDIKREINTVYDVVNVTLTGSVRRSVLSSTWPLSCPRCFNCGCEPSRRRYGGSFADQGYCAACLVAVERREAAKHWNREQPDTWRHVYLDKTMIKNHYSAEDFEVYRNAFINEAELRLAQLRKVEGKRRGQIPVDGVDIEDLRDTLLKFIRRKSVLSRDNQKIENTFNPEERLCLYVLLTELTETIQWKFPWWRAMNEASNHFVTRTRLT
jgi:hypothetical protein